MVNGSTAAYNESFSSDVPFFYSGAILLFVCTGTILLNKMKSEPVPLVSFATWIFYDVPNKIFISA